MRRELPDDEKCQCAPAYLLAPVLYTITGLGASIASMRDQFKVEKLSDELGIYDLDITCRACKHMRRITPGQLARKFGWEASLYVIQPKLVCTKCGHRGATLQAKEITRPRGYVSH